MIDRTYRRRAVAVREVIRITPLRENRSLPLVFTPTTAGVDIFSWIKSRRELVGRHLQHRGGLLFRGFNIKSSEQLRLFISACTDEPLLEYTYRSTPRTQLQNRIYTSTEYPADQVIPLHNEASYANRWPGKIWFCCQTAAGTGGETPIADSRAVYAAVPAQIRDLFIEKKIMYVRNYGPLDLSWQEVFGTRDRDEVEIYCRANHLEYQWVGEEGLRTRQVCPATLDHPGTGEPVWFNQAHLFHASNLPSSIRETLRRERGEEVFPRNAFFGDGSPIGDEMMHAIRQVYDQLAIAEPWQVGDVMYLDNILTAHGRRPFSGERSVLVGMTGALNGGGA